MKNSLLKTVLCTTLLLGTLSNTYTMEEKKINNSNLFGTVESQNSINDLNNNEVQNRIIRACYNRAKECFDTLAPNKK